MIAVEEMSLIGSGATSDVYSYGDNRVLKLFHADYGRDSAEYEANLAREISRTEIRAPRFYELITVNGRTGIVYEYVPGPMLMSELMESRLGKQIACIKRLALTQYGINQARDANIVSQVDRLSYLIRKAEGIEGYRDAILSGLACIEQERQVCHGDLHAGNVIVNDGEYVTIDWMNCYSGNAEGDILRSYLTLITPFAPFRMNPVRRVAFRLMQRLLGFVYLRDCLRLAGLKRASLKKWYPIIAAARMADNVPGERDWLIRMIRKNVKYLPAPGHGLT